MRLKKELNVILCTAGAQKG